MPENKDFFELYGYEAPPEEAEEEIPAYEPPPGEEEEVPYVPPPVPDWPERPGRGFAAAIWDEIRGFFSAMFTSVWSGFIDVFKHCWKLVTTEAETKLSEGEDAAWDAIFKALEQVSVIDRQTIENLLAFRGLPFPINSILYVIALVSVLGTYLTDLGRILSVEAKHDLMAQVQGEIPDYRDLVRAAFIAPEKTTEVREAMKKHGFSDKWIDLLFLGAYATYPEDVIRTLWLRGELSDDEMFMRMRELGYTDTRIKEIIKSWEVLPSVGDLISMAVREAFSPEIAERFGQYEDFPPDFAYWAKKLGLSEEWAKRYWAAHWNLPSVQMGYEMLHRGIITEEELKMLMRAQDIMPFWRDKLIQLSYVPFTRVDVRRMYGLGVLTEEELIKAYKDLGYDDWHAQKLAEFTIRYERSDDRDLSKSEILTAYRERLITWDDARALLEDIGYSRDRAEYLLILEDYKVEKEIRDLIIKNIQDRYTNNLIDAYEARKRLGELNLPAQKIDALMERWNIEKFEDRKLPSKSDLDKMLKAKIIDEDTYRAEMYKLGYGVRYTDWYLQLAKKKK